MLRVQLANNWVKRTLRPLYGFTQSTPKAVALDPNYVPTDPVYPGYALCYTGPNSVNVPSGANSVPEGLSGLFLGNNTYALDEVAPTGINAMALWVLENDAEFEVLAPAFDTTATWAVDYGTTNVDTYVYAAFDAGFRGMLVPAAHANRTVHPVARLLQVKDAQTLVVGGLPAAARSTGGTSGPGAL